VSRVYLGHGDARALLGSVPAGSARLVLSSPPYVDAMDYGGYDAAQRPKWFSGPRRAFAEYLAEYREVVRQLADACAPDAVMLKAQWLCDPCWDLEETPGFAAHRDELRQYRQAHEDQRAAAARAELERFAAALGVDDNLLLAAFLRRLEQRVEAMATRREPPG
jgi:hypothetical protein